MRIALFIMLFFLIACSQSTQLSGNDKVDESKQAASEPNPVVSVKDCGSVIKQSSEETLEERKIENCFAEALEECSEARNYIEMPAGSVEMWIDSDCRVHVKAKDPQGSETKMVCTGVLVLGREGMKDIDFGEGTDCQPEN